MIRPLKYLHFPSVHYPSASRLSSILLLLLLTATPASVLAHAGHGDEFHPAESTPAADAISVDPETVQRIGLKVEPVTRQPLTFGMQATGEIEAAPGRKVEITNPVGGTVVKLLAEPGQIVQAGQPVAVITSGELAELRVEALENSVERQGEIKQAQAELRLAQQNYDRQRQIAQTTIQQAQTEVRVAQEQYDRDRELTQQGAIPRRELLESEAHLAEAKKVLTEAESRLEVLKAQTEVQQAQTAVEVAQSQAQLSDGTYQTRLQQLGAQPNSDGTITIKAPIAGTVTDRQVTLGQSAEDAGEALMTLVDNRTVLATANLPEKDLNQVALGQQVRVTVASLPNRIFTGRITTIGSVVEAERVVPVKTELDNREGLLKPGMFAELELLTDRTSDSVLAIPQSAIVEANGQSLVFVQNGNAFQAVAVTLGKQAGPLVEVKTGLFDGDRIVTQRANQLYAQSLRGGSQPADNPVEAIAPTASNSPPSIPWWVGIPVGGVIMAGAFGAGIVWANRRNRKTFVPVPNGHVPYESLDDLSLTEAPSSLKSASDRHPHQPR